MRLRHLNLFIITFLTACVVLVSEIPVANAAAKAGQSCKKVGATEVVGSKKFTCVKSGKKLVWDKGFISSAAKPTPSVTPTPSATPTIAVPAVPTSFDDLFEKRSGIAYALWSSANRAMKNNKSSLPPVEIFRGPNTPTYLNDAQITSALDDVSKLYFGYAMPKKIQIFIYSRNDLQWGIDKAKSVMGVEYANAESAHGGQMIKCNTPDDCNDGDAFVGSNEVAYMAVGLSAKPDRLVLERYMSATTETTEFYHSIQEYFYELNHSMKPNVGGFNPSNKPPHWLNVAGENVTSSLVRFKDDYQGFRREIGDKKSWIAWIGMNFDAAWVDSYLDISNLNNMWSSNRGGTNSQNAALMGQFLVEIFVALKGPGIMLDFHKEMSAGASFEATFQKMFGTTWTQAQPMMSKVILELYKSGY